MTTTADPFDRRLDALATSLAADRGGDAELVRRFVIVRRGADDEPAVYLVGMQTAGHAVACTERGRRLHRAARAEGILSHVGSAEEAHLIWLDPGPGDGAGNGG